MALHGSPYWGTTTFNDMREILVNISNYKVLPYENMSLYDILYDLACKDYVIIINNFFSWVRDIKYNYRDKAVYVPYYEYKETEIKSNKKHKHLDSIADDKILLKHSFNLKFAPILIHTDLKMPEIIVADTKTKEVFKVVLQNRDYYKGQFSIKTLYSRYLNASYFDEAWEEINFTNKYHWIKSCKGENLEYSLRASRNLPHVCTCSKEVDSKKRALLDYTDIRLYSLEVIETVYKFNLNTSLQFWERRFLFDAYLLFNMLQESDFEEPDENSLLRKLGKGLDYFMYDLANFPMYLKHYYKLRDSRPRASYEKYLSKSSMEKAFEVINKEG